MEKRKKAARIWLVIAVACMLVSMVGASAVQTSNGKVTVKDLRWETTLGHQMSGLLLLPEGVTAENPAPAVVVSHGMFNNREMQDLNYVELSRRGYVVLSMDMFNHGNSENYTNNVGGILVGMYEAVKMLDSLSYVDSTRIGITGHSLGGMSSNMAVTLDNMAERPLISAVLLNCADATYVDSEQAYANVYGKRNVGIIAAQYDEFFMRQDDGNGGKTAPRDYIKNSNAQSFLYFGTDPASQELRVADTMYRDTVDGAEAIRVIYNPAILHPWSHFSQQSTRATLAFFDAALGTPNPIAPDNQVWQWKVAFNALGLLGFGMFIPMFAILMVFTPFFSSLRAGAAMTPVTLGKKGGRSWFWGGLLAAAAFSTIIYIPVLNGFQGFGVAKGAVMQNPPWAIGMWAAFAGLFAILLMAVSFFAYGKKNGFSARERGVTISLKQLGKTVLLALIVVVVSYGWVFVADYFFKTDFRLWVIAIKAFGVDKVLIALFPYMPLYLVFYVANSVSINCFNLNDLGKKEWVNTAILAVFNALPAIILLALQYVYFFISGQLLFASNMAVLWLFPFLAFLPVSAIIARKVYRATGNPYLPGIINGVIITLIACSNTLTWF